MKRIQRKAIIFVVLLAMFVRCLLALGAYYSHNPFNESFEGDTVSYSRPAKSLLRNGTFVNNGRLEIFRTPGYSILFFPGIIVNRVGAITVTLQILLSCLSVFLVYKIGEMLFPKSEMALAGSILFALEPMSVAFSCLLMPETLFTAMIVTFLFFLLKYQLSGRPRSLLISSLFLSASIYVRPIAYFLPWVTFTLLLLVPRMTDCGPKPKTRHVIAFLLLSVVAVTPWHARNGIETGYWGFCPIGVWNLYCMYAPAVACSTQSGSVGQDDTSSLGRRFCHCIGDPTSCFPVEDEFSEYYRIMKREAVEAILNNSRQSVVIAVKGVAKLFLAPGSSEPLHLLGRSASEEIVEASKGKSFLQKRLIYLTQWPLFFFTDLILGLWLWFTLLLALGGIVYTRLYRTCAGILLLGVALYLVVVSAGPLAGSRLREPLMPIVCVCAGPALWHLWELRKRERPKLHIK